MKSLRYKLLLFTAVILLCCQFASIVWIWHEGQELIEVLLDETLKEKQRNDIINEEIEETIAAIILPSVIMVSVTLLIMFFMINKLTKPLSNLTQQLDNRSMSNLIPLPSDYSSTEINAVTHKVNELFVRINQGMESERRFTADVAHELRTPLAGLRLNLELLALQTEKAEPLIEHLDKMILSVEQLLQLARAEQKLLKNDASGFNFATEVLWPMRIELEEEGFPHQIVWEIDETIEIVGDSGLIFLVLRNLLENIRKYAANSTKTIIRLTRLNQKALLEVIDEGPGVDSNVLSMLTKRFVRMDETQKGHGLGLNITERIIHAHQGSLSLQNRTDQSGFVVSIQLPNNQPS